MNKQIETRRAADFGEYQHGGSTMEVTTATMHDSTSHALDQLPAVVAESVLPSYVLARHPELDGTWRRIGLRSACLLLSALACSHHDAPNDDQTGLLARSIAELISNLHGSVYGIDGGKTLVIHDGGRATVLTDRAIMVKAE